MSPGYPIQLAVCLLSIAVLLGACAAPAARTGLLPDVTQQRSDKLGQAIMNLGDQVDPGEARRAARIAIEYPQRLARQYRVWGKPIYHNLMVNLGLKPRGLCIDWTADLLARLQQERFESLEFQWAIANYDVPFRFEHSTVIVGVPGSTIYDGLILDGWRNSGDLYWAPTLEDTEYPWKPRAEVIALKRQHQAARANRRTQQ